MGRLSRGEAKVRYSGDIACSAWEGGHAQAMGAPLFLLLPRAVSRQRKPPGTEPGVWRWSGEKRGYSAPQNCVSGWHLDSQL